MKRPRSGRRKPSTAPARTPRTGAASSLESHQGASPLDAHRREIGELLELLKQHGLAEVEFEKAGVRIRLRRDAPGAAAPPITWESAPLPQDVQAESRPEPAPAASGSTLTVTSPIVGTFYRSPSPDADPYVEEGDFIKKGQVLCIVEAMKLMNEIESEVDGRLVKILAESTKPVEYGQPLFLIELSPSS